MSENLLEGITNLTDKNSLEEVSVLGNTEESDATDLNGIIELDYSKFKDTVEYKNYKHADNNSHYTVEDYAFEKKLDRRTLYTYELENKHNGIIIPYYNLDNKLVRNKICKKFDNNITFYWDEGTETLLYNLWSLKDYKQDYIIFVDNEIDCHTLMQLNIPVLGMTTTGSFKNEYIQYFEHFSKIYIHSSENDLSEKIIKRLSSFLPVDKLYKITSSSIDETCKNINDLHIKGKLDVKQLLNNAIKISAAPSNASNAPNHVDIGQRLMSLLHLVNYNGNLYTYTSTGVYELATDSLLKNCIVKQIFIGAKKNLCNEAIEFVKSWLADENIQLEVDDRYINFKNGLFDLDNECLIEHTTNIFTVNQINVNYLSELPPNPLVDNFLLELMNYNEKRVKALLQSLGYILTARTNIQQIQIWYRTICF